MKNSRFSFLNIIILSVLSFICIEASAFSVTLTTAGTLKDKLASQSIDLTDLTINGPMNDEDWAALKDFPYLVTLDMSGVTSTTKIPDLQFEKYAKLTTYKFPSAIKEIGNSAFATCPLTGVITIPNSVTKIGNKAFATCTKITSINMLNTAITNIGSEAFQGCTALTSISFPKKLTVVSSYCCNGCTALTTATLPSDVLYTVNPYSFYSCTKLATVNNLSMAQAINTYAFYNCTSLTEANIGRCVTVGDYAFYQCSSMVTADLSSCKDLGGYAFRYTKIKEIDLPVIKTIGYSVFDVASSVHISKIHFGGALRDVKGNVFFTSSITGTFTTVTLDCAIPPSYSMSISLASKVYVPDYALSMYQKHDQWKSYKLLPHTNPVSDVYIYQPFELVNASARIPNTPNLHMDGQSSLTIHGFRTAQSFKEVTMLQNLQSSSNTSYQYSQMLSNCDNATAQKTNVQLQLKSGKWYFLSLPFDCVMSTVKSQSGSEFVIRYYDGNSRAVNKTATGNWKNVASSTTLKAGQGYIIQVAKDDVLTFTATTGTKDFPFKNVALATNVNKNTSSDSRHQGWNLVGNPWLTYYDIYHINHTAPILVWTGSTYKALSIIDDNYALAPMEAFFVVCQSGQTQVQFPKDGRQLTSTIDHSNLSSSAKRMARSGIRRNIVDINIELASEVTEDAEQESEQTAEPKAEPDRTRVVFNNAYSELYEMDCDAQKMMSMVETVPQIYTINSEGIQFAINEGVSEDNDIQLGFYAPVSGTYTFSLSRADAPVTITDNLTGETVSLDEPYTFYSEAGTINDRFTVKAIVDETTAINSANVEASALNSNAVYNLNGQKVGSDFRGIVIRNGKKTVVK